MAAATRTSSPWPSTSESRCDRDEPDRSLLSRAAAGRSGLVTFVTAGDPDYATSLAILEALPEAGADLIELGMPFTDPMADGPAIQAAGLALKSGQTMVKTLEMVRHFRRRNDSTPLVLMGYYNPIYIYGVERFLADARTAGVDGLIVVDLPLRRIPSSASRPSGPG